MERAQVIYSGYVQGVGFRFTARSIASRYSVAGFVRNLPDGNVEIVAEGPKSDLVAFLDELISVMADHVDNVHTLWEPATGEFRRFGIRF